MPSLQIRDLPEHIYQKLREEAARQHRSLAQQAVYVLSKGLEAPQDPKGRRQALIDRIRSIPSEESTDQLKDPVELIRQDRER